MDTTKKYNSLDDFDSIDDFEEFFDLLSEEGENLKNEKNKVFTPTSTPPDDDEFEFVDYRSQGVCYKIPKLKRERRYYIDNEIKVTISGEPAREISTGNNSFYIQGGFQDKTMEVSFGLYEYNCTHLTKHMMVAIYREGVGEPIWKQTYEQEEFINIDNIKCSHWEYGKHFMLICGAHEKSGASYITMGDSIRFNLSLLQHGESMEKCTINEIALHRTERMREGDIVEKIVMTIKLDKKPGDDNEFTFHCTGNDYQPMLTGFDASFRGRKSIKQDITSDMIWTAGTYWIYCLQNGEPTYKAMVRYDGETFMPIQPERVLPNSDDYLYMKHLLTGCKADRWRRLAILPGLNGCKREVIAKLKSIVLNDMREKYSLKGISTSANYCTECMEEGFLKAFVPLATPNYQYKIADCNSLTEQRYSTDPLEEVKSFIGECSYRTMVLHNIGALLTSTGQIVIEKIGKWIQEEEHNCLLLCGSESECTAVIESSPVMQSIFAEKKIIKQENYSLCEQIHCMRKILETNDFFVEGECKKQLVAFMTAAREKGDGMRWRKKDLEKIFKEKIYPRICERILNMPTSEKQGFAAVSMVEPGDLDIDFSDNAHSQFDKSMSELNAMTGLRNLKQHLNTMFYNMKIENMRRSHGLSVSAPGSHHMLFTGNPGTGKSTVARKIGAIFHSLGVLSKGDVIITERSKLVGRYIGETERNMQTTLEMARGNVLFIDEAYTLCDNADDRKDFGAHVIDALLTVLAQPNPDMLIIFAGYEKEINRMMEINQGLSGRFPFKLHFDDYSAEELMQIATGILTKQDYQLNDDAAECLREGIASTLAHKDSQFSNARWATQLIQAGILPSMSMRLMTEGNIIDREALTVIKKCDVERGLEKFAYTPTIDISRPKIGFAV
ncbi:MAG: AAA family ATPase [Bacteroidaceae bacterium]|nr:AAA family ATPase [Bacteroidaceae bacterium]